MCVCVSSDGSRKGQSWMEREEGGEQHRHRKEGRDAQHPEISADILLYNLLYSNALKTMAAGPAFSDRMNC